MKLHLKFDKKDFDSMRSFEKAVKKQLGNNCYVGTNSICLYFEYPNVLSEMLRPFPKTTQLEFELESSLPDKQ